MLANRPRGIAINKNVNNLGIDNSQPKAPNAGDQDPIANLKRPYQQAEQPRKVSKTPSPPKLTSHLANNFKKISENAVPQLIDLSEPKLLDLDLPKKQPYMNLKSLDAQPNLKPKQELITKKEPLQQLRQSTTQAVISRIPRLRGDVEETKEEIEDIDKSGSRSRDAIFLVSDVAQDIFTYLYELEDVQSVKEDFLKDQKIYTPKVRQRLIDWLIELSRRLECDPETMYMTVAVIDRYFAAVNVEHRNHVQLVALGALLVASKYEQIWPPSVEDLIKSADNPISRRDMFRAEIDILEKLNFDLGRPIPLAFLRRYSRAAHCDHKMHSMAKFLMELTLSEYECAHWKPSLVAATALFIIVHLVFNNQQQQAQPQQSSVRHSSAALQQIGNTFGASRRLLVSAAPVAQERWNKTLVHYTRYTRRDLQAPAATICKILKRSLKSPPVNPIVKHHSSDLNKWPEFKSTRVDELIRVGQLAATRSNS